MYLKCFGEFTGTLVLILLGDGVVANVLLKHSKAEGAGWMVITSGWAFAVMAGVFTAIACGSADAHLNPAVTMGFAVSSGQFAKFAPYLVAQMAGAFVGAILVWLHFLPHWRETKDQGLKLGCFCTAPAIRSSLLTGSVTRPTITASTTCSWWMTTSSVAHSGNRYSWAWLNCGARDGTSTS